MWRASGVHAIARQHMQYPARDRDQCGDELSLPSGPAASARRFAKVDQSSREGKAGGVGGRWSKESWAVHSVPVVLLGSCGDRMRTPSRVGLRCWADSESWCNCVQSFHWHDSAGGSSPPGPRALRRGAWLLHPSHVQVTFHCRGVARQPSPDSTCALQSFTLSHLASPGPCRYPQAGPLLGDCVRAFGGGTRRHRHGAHQSPGRASHLALRRSGDPSLRAAMLRRRACTRQRRRHALDGGQAWADGEGWAPCRHALQLRAAPSRVACPAAGLRRRVQARQSRLQLEAQGHNAHGRNSESADAMSAASWACGVWAGSSRGRGMLQFFHCSSPPTPAAVRWRGTPPAPEYSAAVAMAWSILPSECPSGTRTGLAERCLDRMARQSSGCAGRLPQCTQRKCCSEAPAFREEWRCPVLEAHSAFRG
jgi:hypothetical protein